MNTHITQRITQYITHIHSTWYEGTNLLLEIWIIFDIFILNFGHGQKINYKFDVMGKARLTELTCETIEVTKLFWKSLTSRKTTGALGIRTHSANTHCLRKQGSYPLGRREIRLISPLHRCNHLRRSSWDQVTTYTTWWGDDMEWRTYQICEDRLRF